MTANRGLLLLGIPVLATLGLFMAVSSVRKVEELPAPPRRVVRVVGGQEVVTYEPAAPPRTPSGGRSTSPTARPLPTRMPTPVDIEAAAEMSRVQSTYENYRTAVMTQNDDLQRSLFGVLRRDREAAMACARQHAAWASSDSERAFAMKTLSELAH